MKSRRKDKTERKKPCQPWGSYAEEIGLLLLVGRRPETESGWLGSDAGEYCGETGENCENYGSQFGSTGVLPNCEPVETVDATVLV